MLDQNPKNLPASPPEKPIRILIGDIFNTSKLTLEVWLESTRVFPITETLPVTIGSAAERENQRQNDEADNDQDFQATEPEFKLPEKFNPEVVDRNDSD